MLLHVICKNLQVNSGKVNCMASECNLEYPSGKVNYDPLFLIGLLRVHSFRLVWSLLGVVCLSACASKKESMEYHRRKGSVGAPELQWASGEEKKDATSDGEEDESEAWSFGESPFDKKTQVPGRIDEILDGLFTCTVELEIRSGEAFTGQAQGEEEESVRGDAIQAACRGYRQQYDDSCPNDTSMRLVKTHENRTRRNTQEETVFEIFLGYSIIPFVLGQGYGESKTSKAMACDLAREEACHNSIGRRCPETTVIRSLNGIPRNIE